LELKLAALNIFRTVVYKYNCLEFLHPRELWDGKLIVFSYGVIVFQRSGIMFPRRPADAPPIFTPPVTQHSQAYGSPRYPSESLNERMTSDVQTLRLHLHCPIASVHLFVIILTSCFLLYAFYVYNRYTPFFSLEGLNSIKNVTELLCDMVNALNPADRMAVKDEIITDLVSQCRSNQQKLMQFIGSTG
jgi:hypothetical protein